MIKNIGLLMLIITGAGMGWTASHALNKRVRSLEKLQRFIELFSVKIKFSSASVNAILYELYSGDFRSFSFLEFLENQDEKGFSAEKWNEYAERFYIEDGFKKDDISILKEFASQLGRTDLEGQLSHCDMCVAKIHGIIKLARDEETKKGKLYFSLGTMAGIAVAIVLI